MEQPKVMNRMLELIEQKVLDSALRRKLLEEMRNKHVKFVLAEFDEHAIDDFDDNQQNLIKEAFYLWG